MSSNKKIKYSTPIITKIKLDPEQAVLAGCSRASESKYQFGDPTGLCTKTAGSGYTCATTRGGASIDRSNFDTGSIPS